MPNADLISTTTIWVCLDIKCDLPAGMPNLFKLRQIVLRSLVPEHGPRCCSCPLFYNPM